MDEEKKELSASQKTSPKSLDDLKAKLGIAQKAKPLQPQPEKVVKPESFSFSLDQPLAQPVEFMEIDEKAISPEKKEVRKWLIVIAGTAVIFSFTGLIFGKIFKERGISNYEVKEAKHLLEYFTTYRTPKLAPEDQSTLKVIENHIEEALNIIQEIDKAADEQARIKAEKDLYEFLKKCKIYVQKEPVFSIEGAFPGVIYHKEVAFQTAQFIAAVQNLFYETAILALESETLEGVTSLEDRGNVIQTLFVEETQKEGEKWLKGKWLREVVREEKREGAGGTEYGVIPYEGNGFYAPTNKLVEVDISLIAKLKSKIYKNAIESRVMNGLGRLKRACDQVSFKPLKEKLEKIANRGEHFLAF